MFHLTFSWMFRESGMFWEASSLVFFPTFRNIILLRYFGSKGKLSKQPARSKRVFDPENGGDYVRPKRRYTSTRLKGVKSQYIAFLIP
jgi:hypothetical protein